MNNRVVDQQQQRRGERGHWKLPGAVQGDGGDEREQADQRDSGDARLVLVLLLLEPQKHHQDGDGRVQGNDVHGTVRFISHSFILSTTSICTDM